MAMWGWTMRIGGLSAAALVLWTGVAQAAEEATADELQAGKFVYERSCIHCHGDQGKGDGLAAPYLDPRPRDFTRGLFKFRSTPNGMVPTLEDMEKTETRGLAGTAMSQWRELSARDRRAVLLYVQTFAPQFKEPPPAPINVPPEPPFTRDSVERGKELYTYIQCDKCHGPQGRGDGPSAPDLKDDWDQRPIRATDLNQGYRFKRGSTPQDIYLTLFTGLTGTPMFSIADTLGSSEKEWDLAHYVYWLSLGKPALRK